MSKRLKSKKDKVPKITEEEYVKYISALKDEEDTRPPVAPPNERAQGRANDVLQN